MSEKIPIPTYQVPTYLPSMQIIQVTFTRHSTLYHILSPLPVLSTYYLCLSEISTISPAPNLHIAPVSFKSLVTPVKGILMYLNPA